jgi:hypothetical protein
MIGLKPKPKIVDITRKVGTAETLTESCIHCSIKEKDFYLYYFLQQHPGRDRFNEAPFSAEKFTYNFFLSMTDPQIVNIKFI